MRSGRQIHCDPQVVGKFYKFGRVKRRASPFRPPILLIDASSILRPVLALWLIVWTSATHVLFFGPSLAYAEFLSQAQLLQYPWTLFMPLLF